MLYNGHEGKEPNFLQLLQLLANEDDKPTLWLQRKHEKYSSGKIQNEMLKFMARHVVNDITSSLQTAPFFSLMVIETTDITNKERVVFVCFLNGWISFLTDP